jgi:DNA-binding winged helix-turn-helix (wHTH) protein/TolB-like protein/cytochrome c-type biogenesis protein CcmH/NrfG
MGRIWRFGDCEFDERRRELRVGDTLVDIEVKPLEVLHQLLLHSGEVVTKAELLESVWPGVAVVDGSLATAVSKLRKLLRDDGSVIVTVARVGYKLVAPVHSRSVEPAAWPDLHLGPSEPIRGRDQWRLTRRLGLSPSSEVWLAEHPKTHEARVFKFALDAAGLKSLKREVTVARLLRESLGERPGFVRVLEWNFDTHPFFVESEYAGPNLHDWAEAHGGISQVPLTMRLQILSDVAEAVASAHEVDVLHKDLKPANVLVRSASEGTPQIKVADFGSSSLLEPSRLSALGITNLGFTQSVTGEKESVSGTALYVAPELLAGQSPTVTSDVYALGVLLYQLVVGDFRRPFAPGWESEVADPLIREDIAAAAAGDSSRRIKTAAELLARVRTLDRRRLAKQEDHADERFNVRRRLAAAAPRGWLALAGVLVVLAVVTSLIVGRSSPTLEGPRTVAVLAFENTSSDAAIDFLRLALADEITTMLSRADNLAVRPFSSTSTYETADLDVQKAGGAMRADALVTGRIGRMEDQLRVTLEAIDVDGNALLWRNTVEAPAQSRIATHVQLALAVRGGLVPALGGSVTDTMPEPRSDEAYELYLRSSAIPYDPTPNPRATAMLERAVGLDPAYAPAWQSLARRYYVEAHFGSGDPGMLSRAADAAQRAVALDPSDVGAVAALVTTRVERGEVAAAYEDVDDLVRRRPDSVTAHFTMSYVLRYAGLLDESAAHCERAFLIDRQPVNTALRTCAIVFFVRGDYARSLNYLNLDRESETAKGFRVDMLVRQGRTAEALKIGLPDVPQWRAKYQMLFACVRGRPQPEILALAEQVRPSADPEENYLSAAHLSYCGQTRASGDMLTRAIDGNYCSFPAMDTDPLFANLRSDTAFDNIRLAGQACQQKFLSARARVR